VFPRGRKLPQDRVLAAQLRWEWRPGAGVGVRFSTPAGSHMPPSTGALLLLRPRWPCCVWRDADTGRQTQGLLVSMTFVLTEVLPGECIKQGAGTGGRCRRVCDHRAFGRSWSYSAELRLILS
jgi:hypothetical protein